MFDKAKFWLAHIQCKRSIEKVLELSIKGNTAVQMFALYKRSTACPVTNVKWLQYPDEAKVAVTCSLVGDWNEWLYKDPTVSYFQSVKLTFPWKGRSNIIRREDLMELQFTSLTFQQISLLDQTARHKLAILVRVTLENKLTSEWFFNLDPQVKVTKI